MADQKLNIIFTGDVTQLNKAVQAAVSDLTKFEQKLKDSLGTEAFAGIIQQVDQLKQKLASLATIDIKANPTQALSVIKEVQTGISSLKSSDILLKIDDGKVLQQVQNIDSLLDSLTATVKISFPDVKSQVDKIRSQLGALTINVNATGFDTVIKDIQAKLSSLTDEKLNITANSEQAELVINEILSDLKTLKDAKVLINADGTQAEGVIDRIQGELSSLKGSLSVDTTEFQRRLAQITSGIGEINLKTDVSEVDAAIKSIVGKLQALREIDIRANPEGLFAAVREISSELSNLKDSEVFIKLNDSKALAQIQNIDKQLSSLSASITIDANVKGEIDRIKTQLSGLTVKIGADATVAEAAIKNIQSKLALLQDERFILSADGQQAEAVINEIFTDLKTLKDTKVLINADGSPAENVIEKIRTDLQTSLKGNVTIDTAELQRKIQQISVSEIDLKIDSSQIDVAVRSIREKLVGLQAINIQANPQQALTAINEIFQDIAKIKSSEILLQADNSEALAAINQVQQKVQTIKDKIDVGVNIDTRNLEALIKPLSQKVQIDVSTKQAEAEIKALLNQVKNLKGQDILINLDGTQVLRTVDAIEKELLQLQSKLKSATNPADIARLTQSLQTLKNSLSSVGTNQFSTTMNRAQNATFAFSQVLREAPAFAFSFQTGILALSNNLPILADRLKEARASGVSTGQIFKDIGKSLVSLPGIMTIVSTALIFISGAFNKSKDSAKEAAREIKSAFQVIEESTDSVQGDVAQVGALVNAFKNAEGSFSKQKRIIEELKDVNESYFGDLKAGVSTYEDITKAANDYTNALVNQAIVKGLQDEISELSKQLRAATKEYNSLTKQTDAARKAVDNFTVKAVSGERAADQQATSISTLDSRYKGLNKNLQESAKRVGTLTSQFNDLIGEINKQVLISLDFKPFKKEDIKAFENETDRIIALARAFVKQFGETFVVPDLEESFTNTKDKIKKAAIQLLEDVKNLNLKVRVPAKVDILTEIEIIPILENQKLTEDQLKKLTEGFLQDFQTDKKEIELPVSINIGNIKLLEQVRTIFKSLRAEIPEDIKLKLLDEESFVSFERLNEAIKQAQNNFLLLQTIGDSVGQGLANGFDRVFDALLEGESVFKALGESVKALVVETIKAIAKMLILKAVTKVLGGGIPLPTGGIGGQVNPFSAIGIGGISGRGFVGSAFGGQAAPSLTAVVRGTDLAFVLNQGNNIIGRSG